MNAPTLLIGLGGTGCKIIERVSKMVTGEQRNNIAFAVYRYFRQFLTKSLAR